MPQKISDQAGITWRRPNQARGTDGQLLRIRSESGQEIRYWQVLIGRVLSTTSKYTTSRATPTKSGATTRADPGQWRIGKWTKKPGSMRMIRAERTLARSGLELPRTPAIQLGPVANTAVL